MKTLGKDVKPFGINLNKDQAAILLKGLKALPESDRLGVTHRSLEKDLEMIVTLWDRRVKNQKILNSQMRKTNVKA